MGYCLGVKSEDITLANAEKTAQEFEHYLSDPHCLGIKFYPGYRPVFIYDERHYPLFELARHYNVPVAVHTGDTATPAAKLRYAHPLTLKMMLMITVICSIAWKVISILIHMSFM